MKTERAPWFKFSNANLEIGNFGNEGTIPKSVSCKGMKAKISGSVILRDEVKGNLILDDLVVEQNVIIEGKMQGLIHENNCEIGGFTFLPKNNLEAEFVARDSTMKGIHFLNGENPFELIDLEGSEFEYLFFRERLRELILKNTKVTRKCELSSECLSLKPEISLDGFWAAEFNKKSRKICRVMRNDRPRSK